MSSLVDRAEETLAGQFAQQVLTQRENGDLRAQLHNKKTAKASKKEVTGGPRHMTGAEQLAALKLWEWKDHIKASIAPILSPMLKDLKKRQTEARKAFERLVLEEERAERAAEKANERAVKAADKHAEKEIEKARKAAEKEEKEARKAAEQEVEKARKAVEKERKAAEKEADKAQKALDRKAEKARKAAERAEGLQRAAADGTANARKRRRAAREPDENAPSPKRSRPSGSSAPSAPLPEPALDAPTPPPSRPKPRPRPTRKAVAREPISPLQASPRANRCAGVDANGQGPLPALLQTLEDVNMEEDGA
jgi:hypothetical protein